MARADNDRSPERTDGRRPDANSDASGLTSGKGAEAIERATAAVGSDDDGGDDDGGDLANVAPDAVKDPNEKTGGLPGVPPGSQGGETDPGGS